MDPATIAKQTMGFQKKLFEDSFIAMEVVQDQTEKMIDLFLSQLCIPEEGKKAFNESVGFCKTARDNFKQAVDDSFKKMEDMFSSLS